MHLPWDRCWGHRDFVTQCLCCQGPSNVILRVWGKRLRQHYNAVYVKWTVKPVPRVQRRISRKPQWAGKFRESLLESAFYQERATGRCSGKRIWKECNERESVPCALRRTAVGQLSWSGSLVWGILKKQLQWGPHGGAPGGGTEGN